MPSGIYERTKLARLHMSQSALGRYRLETDRRECFVCCTHVSCIPEGGWAEWYIRHIGNGVFIYACSDCYHRMCYIHNRSDILKKRKKLIDTNRVIAYKKRKYMV